MSKPNIRDPRVPMLPEELPRQRLHEVVELPPRPAGLESRCTLVDDVPSQYRLKGNPGNPTYLGMVEWSWSPMHSRLDAYYLSPNGPLWLLWVRNADPFSDGFGAPEWWVYAWGRRKGVSRRQAAVYLLMDAWTCEAEDHLDQFHMIDDTGLLSVADLSAIAREVW